jgi:hypothetical protein
MAVDGSVRICWGRENNVRTCWKEEEEGEFFTLWYSGAISLADI